MSIQKFFIILMIGLAVFLLYAPVLSADDDLSISQSLAEHGLILLQRENFSEAVSDFSRAFLLNPNNERAEKNLRLLAKHPNVDAKSRAQLLRFEDLLSFTRDLRKRKKYFRFKRDDLLTKMSGQGFDRAHYEQQYRLSDNSIHTKYMNSYYTKSPLEALNADLSAQQQRLSQEVVSLEKQFHYLRNVVHQQQYVQRMPISIPHHRRVRQKRFYTSDGKRIFRESSFSYEEFVQPTVKVSSIYSTEEMGFFKDEIQKLYSLIEEMRILIAQKDERIDDMKQELVKLTLKLTENEVFLNKRSAELSADVVELESRFELGQRIISEKEEKIQSLLSKLIRIDGKYMDEINGLKVVVFSKDEKSRRYKQLLEGYNVKLAEAAKVVARKDAQFQSITDDLGQLKSQFETIRIALKKSNRMKLNTKILNEDYKMLLLSNDEELNELNKVVKEYKDTLNVFTNALREKDETIDDLNNALQQLRDELQQMSKFKKIRSNSSVLS